MCLSLGKICPEMRLGEAFETVGLFLVNLLKFGLTQSLAPITHLLIKYMCASFGDDISRNTVRGGMYVKCKCSTARLCSEP